MTTYELPPEPPIGESVQDVHGRTWKHEGVNRWALKGDDYADDPETRSWHRLFLSGPLTLIEPDPWPTAPLIAAEGRLWFRQEDGDYLDKDGTVRGEGRHVFTGPVVPVTAVPTAPLPVLWSALEQWLNGHSDPDAATNKLVGAVVGLREQIDALELDQ